MVSSASAHITFGIPVHAAVDLVGVSVVLQLQLDAVAEGQVRSIHVLVAASEEYEYTRKFPELLGLGAAGQGCRTRLLPDFFFFFALELWGFVCVYPEEGGGAVHFKIRDVLGAEEVQKERVSVGGAPAVVFVQTRRHNIVIAEKRVLRPQATTGRGGEGGGHRKRASLDHV